MHWINHGRYIIRVLPPAFSVDISVHPNIIRRMKKTIQQFKALADETRLRLLALLLNAGELCVCDLTATLQLPQSTVSRHLAYLKGAGWVSDRRVGVWIYYSIATESPMQQEIADVLRKRLVEIPLVADDGKRLATFSERASCA